MSSPYPHTITINAAPLSSPSTYPDTLYIIHVHQHILCGRAQPLTSELHLKLKLQEPSSSRALHTYVYSTRQINSLF